MRILTKGIARISRKDNQLILTYSRKEDALRAMNEIYEENQDWIDASNQGWGA